MAGRVPGATRQPDKKEALMGKDSDEPEVNPWPGGRTERQAHVNALVVERDMLEQRPEGESRDRRIKEIGEQLDKFEEKPQKRTLETAGGGSSRRGGRRGSGS